MADLDFAAMFEKHVTKTAHYAIFHKPGEVSRKNYNIGGIIARSPQYVEIKIEIKLFFQKFGIPI
jgi:hypothetical protein